MAAHSSTRAPATPEAEIAMPPPGWLSVQAVWQYKQHWQGIRRQQKSDRINCGLQCTLACGTAHSPVPQSIIGYKALIHRHDRSPWLLLRKAVRGTSHCFAALHAQRPATLIFWPVCPGPSWVQTCPSPPARQGHLGAPSRSRWRVRGG